MARKLFTENEIILCTYIARFGRGYFNEKRICRLEIRSESSVKMKVQNIASMLDEEDYPYSSEVSCLSGVTTGEQGRRTNWNIVKGLVESEQHELKEQCKSILSS
jgi:hypothetical protein